MEISNGKGNNGNNKNDYSGGDDEEMVSKRYSWKGKVMRKIVIDKVRKRYGGNIEVIKGV